MTFRGLTKKTLVLFCVLAMVSTVIATCAATGILSRNYSLNQTGTSPTPTPSPTPSPSPTPVISAAFVIDNQPWNGGTINWNQLVTGLNTKTVTITNTGNQVISSVNITSTGLPSGWNETIVVDTPISVGASVVGTINLVADASVSGSQSWVSTITVS